MENLYVVDTNSIISYFSNVFKGNVSISSDALRIIDKAFKLESTRLSIPGIVMVEIFHKWCVNEEISALIRFEVFERIKSRSNIEVKPLDSEVLLNFIQLDRLTNISLENHDRQILASAMTYNCPLISSDLKIRKYLKTRKVIPKLIY